MVATPVKSQQIPAKPAPSTQQIQAWGYYGLPSSAAAAYGSKASTQAVGEVRYVVGWGADQMVRMGWRLTINDSETWAVELPDNGGRIVSDADQDDADDSTHPANASRKLLDAIGWTDSVVRQVTTNLYVAGELYLLNENKQWRVVSVIDPKLSQRIAAAPLKVRGLWAHPADDTVPDAPIFGVLGVLEDLVWLTRLERAQAANRVGMRGILLVSDQVQLNQGDGSDSEAFWEDFYSAIARGMDSPDDLSPVGLRVPRDLIDKEAVKWVIPDFPYDDKLSEKLKALIQRLAYGLPVPPEILLGLQAQSRATAFQVEGNAYRAHIEPVAWTVAQVAQDALGVLLPEVGSLRVIPDPTAILARRHTIEDVLEAFDRGVVGEDYLREALGIPSRAEPTPEERARRALPAPSAPADEDEGQADDPVTASQTPPDHLDYTVTETPGDEWLSEQLARIDSDLLSELIGAAEQALTATRNRIGAAVRSNTAYRDSIPAGLGNAEIAVTVGYEKLSTLGLDVDGLIRRGLEPIVEWWSTRLLEAEQTVTELLQTGNVPVEFDHTKFTASAEMLNNVLALAVFDSLDMASLRAVLNTAGN